MFTANSSVTLDVTRLTLSFSIPLGPLVQTQVSVLLCIQSLYLERNFWSSVPLVQWAYASARPPCQMVISIMRKKDRLFTSRRKTRSWFLFQRQCLDQKILVPLLAMVTTRIHCLPSWSIRRRSDRTHNTKIHIWQSVFTNQNTKLVCEYECYFCVSSLSSLQKVKYQYYIHEDQDSPFLILSSTKNSS